MAGEPLPRNDLIGVFTPGPHRLLDGLPLCAGVDALGEQRLGLLTLCPRLFQPDVGVSPEGEQLLLTPMPELEPPPAAPGGGNKQEQAAAVRELAGLGLGLGIADNGIRKRHGHFRWLGVPVFCGVLCPPQSYPQMWGISIDFVRLRRTTVFRKS